MKMINSDLGQYGCALLPMKHISPLTLVFTYDSYLYLLQNISRRNCGEVCYIGKEPWADFNCEYLIEPDKICPYLDMHEKS